MNLLENTKNLSAHKRNLKAINITQNESTSLKGWREVAIEIRHRYKCEVI